MLKQTSSVRGAFLIRPSSMHCNRCWREDMHVPVLRDSLVAILLTLITFGGYLLVRRWKCSCCGKRRFFWSPTINQ